MQPRGPVVDPLPCSGCGKLLDPLRAGHVAIFDDRFHFFCDRGRCRKSFVGPLGDATPTLLETPKPEPVRSSPVPLAGRVSNAHAPLVPEDVLEEPPRLDDDPSLAEPIDRGVTSLDAPRVEAHEGRDAGALLLLLAVMAGTLTVLLGLTTGGTLVMLARIALAAVGASMLVARALTQPRAPADPPHLPVLAGPLGAILVAAWAVWRSPPVIAGEAVVLAGLIVTVSGATVWLLELARRNEEGERAFMEHALAAPARRVLADGTLEEGVLDLRAGERVLVEEGEDVPVDMVITEGEADVLPWLGAASLVRRRPRDPVVAGAHVARGRITGITTWSGDNRMFARLVLDPRRRLDVLDPRARAPRSLVERWTVVAAVAAALLSFGITRSGVDAAMTAVAVQAGLATSVIALLPGTHLARGLLNTLRRGVTYKSADAWERASRASVAVFCARGTLLLGEPEVAEVEAVGPNVEPVDVLGLAAGAARAESSPTAQAILRAAKARGVRPDAVRNANVVRGLGVVAVASSGEELCVGSRAHMLEQRIGITAAERRLGELSALGRGVVLVALGGRAIGLIALADGIRPGARAAIQHLLDAQLLPILMSGDSRETCDAIARSLDIEHVRADVRPADRADEVKRIAEAGESVAVFGHTPHDDAALSAADVSIALGAAGAADAEQDIALASDDLRDGALALVVARRTRAEARISFGLAAVPPALGTVLVALGVLPPAFVPIASLLGAAVAVMHHRAGERPQVGAAG